MKCATNLEDLILYGDYDQETARNLAIVFEKCNNDTSEVPCKSQEEFKDWMLEKYIVTLTNEKTFQTFQFDEERVLAQSIIHWYPLSSDRRAEHVNKIQRSNIVMNDSPFNIGQYDTDTGFVIKAEISRDLPYRNDFQNSITYEVSLKQSTYTREVFSFVELLSSIGGLYRSISAIFYCIVISIYFHGVYQFMMDDLFISN